MFEKEAEEYVRKIRHDVINWDGAKPEERFYNEIKFKQAYLAGAEFGYNNAKELEAQIEKMKCLLNEIYSEYGFSELVKIRNNLPIEIQEVIKEIEQND